eukprot:752354-Hanusia_phi.AAC.1
MKISRKQSRLQLYVSSFHKLADVHEVRKNMSRSPMTTYQCDSLLSNVTIEDREACSCSCTSSTRLTHVLVEMQLRHSIIYSKHNPTGHYQLNLSDPIQREVAMHLCEVRFVEVLLCVLQSYGRASSRQQIKNSDLLKSILKDKGGFKTEHEIEKVWRNARLNSVSELRDGEEISSLLSTRRESETRCTAALDADR